MQNLLFFLFCAIQDPDTFSFAWQKTGTSEGGSQLRYNYYPMISDLSKIKPGQIRCGEHTDYGGITLLIQDDVGGLEVRTQLRNLILILSLHLFNTSCVRIILTLLQYCYFF